MGPLFGWLIILGQAVTAYDLEIQNVTTYDVKANFTLACPPGSNGIKEVSLLYKESQGVSVRKTLDQTSSHLIVASDRSSCIIYLTTDSLHPLHIYDICVEGKDSSGVSLDGNCMEIKTIAPIIKEGDAITVNLNGVALIVMTALGLLFALMTCIFYDKVLSHALVRLFASLRNFRKSLGRDKEDKEDKAGSDSGEDKADQKSRMMPPSAQTNGYEEMKIALEDQEEPSQKSLMANGTKTFPLGTDPAAMDDDYIREVLEKRPQLMKKMKVRRTDIPEQQASYDSPAYRDNLGYSNTWEEDNSYFESRYPSKESSRGYHEYQPWNSGVKWQQHQQRQPPHVWPREQEDLQQYYSGRGGRRFADRRY